MAKSIRSKFKRKMRNIKRERYAVKELQRLKNMLGIADEVKTGEIPDANVITFELPKPVQQYKLLTKKNDHEDSIQGYGYNRKGQVLLSSDSSEDEEETMQEASKPEQSSTTESTDMDHSHKRVYNPKTMRDQYGAYPPWFNKRHINKIREKIKRKIKKKKNVAMKIGLKKVKSRKSRKRQEEKVQNKISSQNLTEQNSNVESICH